MSTTLPKAKSTTPAQTATRFDQGPARGSRAVGRLLLTIVLVGLLGVALWGSGHLFSRFSSKPRNLGLTYDVKRGDVLITVTEDGNLESASNLDVKCQVAGGTSILWIVPDGSEVKAGDKLVELDSSILDEQINQQRIAYEKARSTKIQAEKTFAVATLAVQEYLEGTYKQQIQDAEALITISLENLRSAQNSLEHAQRMFRKGYVSNLELEGQRFAVERAQLELDSARTAKEVLVNFSKVKMLQDLESQRDTAEAQMKSELAAFELEESRLKRLEAQIAQCTIIAPTDGMVVYANESGRFGQQTSSIEEGATVRERQTLLKLPDLSKMQVKVNVHESKVDQLKPGMRARIRILDREKTGTVTSIANQPEPTGWFSANVKEYATHVRVDGEPENLRPGMTAEVEILVAHLKDVVSLPVVAVVEQRGEYYCWVRDGEKVEKRTLVLGMSNDQLIEVKDGVSPGEKVLLNPRAFVDEARTSPHDADKAGVNVNERFGESSKEDASTRGGAVGGPRGADGTDGPPRGSDGGGASPGTPPGAPEGGPPTERRRGGGPAGNLMQLDKDGDGKISRDEAPETMRQFFDRMDTDGDGFVNRAEANAVRQRLRAAGGEAGGPPGGPPATP